MKQKTLIKVVLFCSLMFICAGIAGTTVLYTTFEKLTDENTENTATVINVEIKDGIGRIYTEEYGDRLCFREDYVDTNAFKSLQAGQPVFFRIENAWVEQFEDSNFDYIVSLKTAEKEIFPLTRYNEHSEQEISGITIFCIVFIPILLLVSIHCILLLRGVNVIRRWMY